MKQNGYIYVYKKEDVDAQLIHTVKGFGFLELNFCKRRWENFYNINIVWREKTWSKSQYYYKIVDSNIAKEEFEKLNKMIQYYNQKIEEVWKQKEEFLNFFEWKSLFA